MQVSLFLPVYNSEKFIRDTLKVIHSYLKLNFQEFEIVVVDDNSTDQTVKEVNSYAGNKGNIKVIKCKNGPSRRENLAKAMFSAKYDNIIFIDADLSPNFRHIGQLCSLIESNATDIAIGSRYMGIKPDRALYRSILSRVYNVLWRVLFKSKIRDHNCGLKAFRKEKLIPLLKDLDYDHTLRRGWFWDVQLLICAQHKGMKITELPIEWNETDSSTFSILREIRMVPFVFSYYRSISMMLIQSLLFSFA